MRTLSKIALFAAGWSAVAMMFAMQTYSAAWYAGVRVSWRQAITIAVAAWYIRALLVPLGFWLARRMPLRFTGNRGVLVRNTAVHSAVAVVAAGALQVVYAILMAQITWIPRRASFNIELPMNVVTYCVAVAVAHGLDYYNRTRDRELAASQLEAELAGARLDALRAQLHPHFLFNTLNGIAELVHEDAEAADAMLNELAQLLRAVLQQPARHVVPLADELEFVERYLRLQQIRFGDRLRFRLNIAPETRPALVPFLVLQPLVENAVLHGIATQPEGGHMEIASCREGEWLLLRTQDDGAGCAAPAEGMGLRSTRLRLRHSYGDAQAFEFKSSLGKGTTVELRLPFNIAEPAEGAHQP
jgi:two-component system, LytTR family, sensor kinase